jgi:hypothetical protein
MKTIQFIKTEALKRKVKYVFQGHKFTGAEMQYYSNLIQ